MLGIVVDLDDDDDGVIWTLLSVNHFKRNCLSGWYVCFAKEDSIDLNREVNVKFSNAFWEYWSIMADLM